MTEPCRSDCPSGDCAGCAFPPTSTRHSAKVGIYDLEDIRARCVVDEITGCWAWKGSSSGNSLTAGTRNPNAWFPRIGRVASMGVIICWLVTDAAPAPGHLWARTCAEPMCVCPWHRESRKCGGSEAGSLTRAANISLTKRKRSRLSEADIDEMRSSTETIVACAARFGVDKSYVSKVRLGQLRRPIGARGSSVFNLGAAR